MNPITKVRCAGLTIVDLLVALLLLAPCILGIAALKAERVRKNDNSVAHDRAILLSGEAAKLITVEYLPGFRYETSAGLVCDSNLQAAQRERLAANAVACWQDKVANGLPNGSGAIALDSRARTPSYVVTISWSNPEAGTASYVARVPARVQ